MILEEWTGDKLIADTGALAGHGGTALKGSAYPVVSLSASMARVSLSRFQGRSAS